MDKHIGTDWVGYCPKCGSKDLTKKHCPPFTRNELSGIVPEHLEITCICGYGWQIDCLDNNKEFIKSELIKSRLIKESNG